MTAMASITDRLIRETHRRLLAEHADAGGYEIIDQLAYQVARAAGELVRPAKWVGAALQSAGVCRNGSEAQARIARLVASQAKVLDDAVSMMTWTLLPGVHEREADAFRAWSVTRMEATARLEREIGTATLEIHARLESCSLDELAQAAITMIRIAGEAGDPDLVESVTLSLLLFSGTWDEDRGTGPSVPLPDPGRRS